MYPLYRNQSIDLQCKSIDCFLDKRNIVLNRFMHNVKKSSNILYRSCGVHTIRFLKYVWPFFNIIYETVNAVKCTKLTKCTKVFMHQTTHRVKSVCIRSFCGPYAVRMRENTDQRNSEYGHFLRSDILYRTRVNSKILAARNCIYVSDAAALSAKYFQKAISEDKTLKGIKIITLQ